MKITYKKIDENTIEITETFDPVVRVYRVTKKSLEDKKLEKQADIAECQKALNILTTA